MSDVINDMKGFSDQLDDAIKAYIKDEEPKNLIDAVRQYPYAGGKRMRPAMVLASCAAVGGKKENAVPIAVAIEYIHNFTLIHDDLMDGDERRRGMETSHVKYGMQTAVLAGDALFAKSIQVIANADIPPKKMKEILQIITQAVWDLARGQQMDINFENGTEVTVEDYIEMIRLKTSVLFAAGAASGAVVGGASKRFVKAIHEYAMLLGVAFQIYDDVLGIMGDPAKTGKSAGNDIRKGKNTLIVCHAKAKIRNKKKMEKFLEILGKSDATEEEIQTAREILDEYGCIKFAKDTAEKYRDKAIKKLNCLPESKEKQFMIDLAEFSMKRES